jgi:hypothetical protein
VQAHVLIEMKLYRLEAQLEIGGLVLAGDVFPVHPDVGLAWSGHRFAVQLVDRGRGSCTRAR